MSEAVIVDDNQQVWIMQDGELANQIRQNARKNIKAAYERHDPALREIGMDVQTGIALYNAIKADLEIDK